LFLLGFALFFAHVDQIFSTSYIPARVAENRTGLLEHLKRKKQSPSYAICLDEEEEEEDDDEEKKQNKRKLRQRTSFVQSRKCL
jgi:UPF0716 family protein affecting phage T7 exclusion